ncbi:MAG: SIR2 family protein [Balneolales bacterium]
MAKYTFLIGSGVSLKSGVKNVTQVTDALFSDPYHEYNMSFIKGKNPSDEIQIALDASPIQEFIKLLQDKCNHYLRERGELSQANYEDLFDLISQIRDESKNFRDNLAVNSFCSIIEKESLPTRKKYRRLDGVSDLGEFCEKSLRYIEAVIKYSLNEKQISGLKVLQDIMEKKHQLNIFTLNHDLLIEKLCDQNNIKYSDGFSVSDGDVRWYQPISWDNGKKVKIYKLHGSRNWKYVRHKIRGDRYAITKGNNFCEDADGIKVDTLLDKGYMLTGYRKSESYYSGIHGEIHYRFAEHLRMCKNLVVSGYGWNDVQITLKLFDWLDSEDDRKIIIVHADPVNMANSSRHLPYNRFQPYVQRGKIILIKKWFQDITLEDIIKYET